MPRPTSKKDLLAAIDKERGALGTYLVSATSSHYLWARKEIRKGLRAKA